VIVLRAFVMNNTQLAPTDLGSAEMLPSQPAILVISIVPILLIDPALQKHFTKGVLTGAVKAWPRPRSATPAIRRGVGRWTSDVGNVLY
ncbi:MAG: hypothetical protein J2P17_30265, partial [Mycobacterium sp.]|nr:hypothetical protein [Mycobacterium sp.]